MPVVRRQRCQHDAGNNGELKAAAQPALGVVKNRLSHSGFPGYSRVFAGWIGPRREP
jgi:hypothetical protein